MSQEAYPLHWPTWQQRTPREKRQRARFSQARSNGSWVRSLSMAAAMDRLERELDRLGARAVVLSCNVERRLDGQPYSNRKTPDDTGVAVYFTLRGNGRSDPYCLACDRWDRVEDNIAAVAAHINAMRGQERWGVGTQAQAFAGYKALPPGTDDGAPAAEPEWWQVLGFSTPHITLPEAHEKYRDLGRVYHPDVGSNPSTEYMARVNTAWAEAKERLQP